MVRQQLTQSSYEIDRAQMRVALKHFELAMSRDGADLCDVETLLKEPGDRLMAQIVEMEVGHARSDAEMLKGESHGISGHRKHPLNLRTSSAKAVQGFDSATR